jgi:hypothetical protein
MSLKASSRANRAPILVHPAKESEIVPPQKGLFFLESGRERRRVLPGEGGRPKGNTREAFSQARRD